MNAARELYITGRTELRTATKTTATTRRADSLLFHLSNLKGEAVIKIILISFIVSKVIHVQNLLCVTGNDEIL